MPNVSFSAELRTLADPLWSRELTHPFVSGIGDGTLDIEIFQFYLKQDYIFLIEYSRAIAIAAAKATDLEDMAWFSRLLEETLNTEMALHIDYCKEFGIEKVEILATTAQPGTHKYTQHLISTAYSKSPLHTAVAILPCAWGYAEIGQELAKRKTVPQSNLYKKWIDMYSSEEFEDLAKWLRSYIDREALLVSDEEKKALARAFLVSSEYEYEFWDCSYKMHIWSFET